MQSLHSTSPSSGTAQSCGSGRGGFCVLPLILALGAGVATSVAASGLRCDSQGEVTREREAQHENTNPNTRQLQDSVGFH
ncbi:hypothetical protein EGR_05768 [Echinococcus granulosus]|uniref:Uncharacterized protein n=1 Tax=Echinococcus granulosus TaxID=6210 RepID=W6V0B0_ECHGR|nr:hypothetical protein EGR_05768 [Echinococcus granulosus]EUB59414.1 hypothetical protein EGR_05768 [Echinococcus granulosus]